MKTKHVGKHTKLMLLSCISKNQPCPASLPCTSSLPSSPFLLFPSLLPSLLPISFSPLFFQLIFTVNLWLPRITCTMLSPDTASVFVKLMCKWGSQTVIKPLITFINFIFFITTEIEHLVSSLWWIWLSCTPVRPAVKTLFTHNIWPLCF